MGQIADGVAVNQMTAGGAYPNFDCGEADCRALGLRFGKDWPVRAIEPQMPNPAGGTDGPALVRFLNNNGLAVQHVPGSLVNRVNGAVARRHVSFSLVTSDSHGIPTPGGGHLHWVENISTSWRVMNSAIGQFVTYSNLPACDAGDGLEVMVVAPCDQGGAPVTVPQGPNYIGRVIRLDSTGRNGFEMDSWGGLHPIGNQPGAVNAPYWPGWLIARDLALSPDGKQGMTLDGYGGIHMWGTGSNPAPGPAVAAPYFGWDVAVEIVVTQWGPNPAGYTFEGWGGIHAWGGAPPINSPAYWPGGVA